MNAEPGRSRPFGARRVRRGGAGPGEIGLRVEEVMERWDRRLAEATAAWQRLPAAERRRRDAELDERGEADEWVLVLWAWWERSAPPEQAQLAGDVRFLASALRQAAADGRLDGPGDEAAAGRHLLEALLRMARILGVDG